MWAGGGRGGGGRGARVVAVAVFATDGRANTYTKYRREGTVSGHCGRVVGVANPYTEAQYRVPDTVCVCGVRDPH